MADSGSASQADAPLTEEVAEPPPDLEEMWEYYTHNKDFFGAIELATDGGMSEASELISTSRYFSAPMPIGFALLNIYSILTTNWNFIVAMIATNAEDPNDPEPGTGTGSNFFLLTVRMYELTTGEVAGTASLTVIGLLEVAVVLFYTFRCVYWLFFICCPGSSENRVMYRWQAVQEFFWNCLPDLGTISTIKLLGFCAPDMLTSDLADVLSDFKCSLVLPKLLYFLLTRIVGGLIGFDALLFKLQQNQAAISSYFACNGTSTCESSGLDIFILCGVFMNQITGMVLLSRFVSNRIFAFIFAGEDSIMSPEEDAIKETWETMLAQKIWERNPKWYQCLAIYLTYNDYDFQQLALETVEESKPVSQRTLSPEEQEKKSARAARRARKRGSAATSASGATWASSASQQETKIEMAGLS